MGMINFPFNPIHLTLKIFMSMENIVTITGFYDERGSLLPTPDPPSFSGLFPRANR